MKIKLDRTPEQMALVKEMASTDRVRAAEARQSFAAIVGPLLQQVLSQAPVVSNLYDDLPFDNNSDHSIPLDFLWDVTDDDYIHIWSQNKPGGLATQLVGGQEEVKFSTYHLDSAISFNKKYIETARLDVVRKV